MKRYTPAEQATHRATAGHLLAAAADADATGCPAAARCARRAARRHLARADRRTTRQRLARLASL